MLWESLIERLEQLQLIKRPGEDYILDKIQNETKLTTDKKDQREVYIVKSGQWFLL